MHINGIDNTGQNETSRRQRKEMNALHKANQNVKSKKIRISELWLKQAPTKALKFEASLDSENGEKAAQSYRTCSSFFFSKQHTLIGIISHNGDISLTFYHFCTRKVVCRLYKHLGLFHDYDHWELFELRNEMGS